MGMQEELAEFARLIESVDGKEGMALEKMHMLSQAGLLARTYHAEIQRNAEDAVFARTIKLAMQIEYDQAKQMRGKKQMEWISVYSLLRRLKSAAEHLPDAMRSDNNEESV
jgi:hypothetical protein